ncbi:MAG: hypothetical protein PVF70_03805 [Anaerolineales bacterium]|jgi:hypothetical protein
MDGTARYRIKVAGRLNGGWEEWFDGMRISHEQAQDGAALTLFESGEIDQAALHGLLRRLRDLNLCLYCVERIEKSALASTKGSG